jgi:PPOX class probable F420-dependent enzyme
MAYHLMTDHEVNAFLGSNPARPGTLATTRVDGRPHVAPVWFVTDDKGDIVFNTGRDTVKGRNLARTLFAALCVQDDRAPYSFVTIEGSVVLSEDLEEVGRWATIIGGRYMGKSRAEEFGARNGVEGELLVRLHPDRIVSAANVAS